MNFIKFSVYRIFASVFIVACLSYTLAVFRIGSSIWGDSHYYFAYTRSLVMDGDIDFANESVEPGFAFPNGINVIEKTGRVANNFSPGTGILWIPAFAISQLVVFILYEVGFPVLTDGYSLIVQLFVGYSAIFYAMSGLFISYLTLCKLFDKKVALLTTGIFLATTQLMYYVFVDPLNSHTVSFFVASLLLYLVVKISGQKDGLSWKDAALFGAIIGALSLIRNQDVVLAIPSAMAILYMSREKTLTFFKLIFSGFVASLIIGIQLLATWTIYHQLNSPYLIQGQSLNWLSPDFIRVLFSQGNGLFYFAPITAIAFVGLAKLLKDKRAVASISLASFALSLYVIAAWGPEIVGGPYGSRMFISVLPFLMVGIGVLAHRLRTIPGIALIVVLTFWNIFQTLQMLIKW